MKKEDAVSYFGSQAKLAKALRISESAVSQWGNDVPESSSYKLQVMTGGELKVNPADYATPANPTAGPQAPALEP